MGIKEEFKKYGAKLDNMRWSVSAIATKPRQAVITVWEDRFPKKGNKRTYRIDTSGWTNRAGRTGTLTHLATASEKGLPVRMVMVRWADKQKKRKDFEARTEWTGYVQEVNESIFSVVFEKTDPESGEPTIEERLVLAAEAGAEFLTPPIDSSEDARQWALTTIAMRRGQAGFRTKLLKAYGGRCAITGCDVTATLEAAHILPFRGDHTNTVNNGLLLRADIHTLFDLGLIWIDADIKTQVATSLIGTSYADLRGRALSAPAKKSNAPRQQYLAEHAEAAQAKHPRKSR